MQFVSMFVMLCMTVLLPACTYISVNYDYEPEFDFYSLKTYGWFPMPKSVEVDELIEKYFIRAVEGEMAIKGYTLKQSDPDFLIAVHGKREKKVDIYE